MLARRFPARRLAAIKPRARTQRASADALAVPIAVLFPNSDNGASRAPPSKRRPLEADMGKPTRAPSGAKPPTVRIRRRLCWARGVGR